jgi:two-component system, OmpR family, sensor histidine kinase SenX3
MVPGRRKPVAFFIALGAGLISVILLLYIGWVLLNWRTGIMLLVGVLLLATIISGI